jgi:carboxymethylenebutenolidase
MCHGDDSLPPAPPVHDEVAEHGELVLTAVDGTRFAAYQARPAEPTGSGVVILPDVRGLHQFYRQLAVRFAEAGLDAVAFDYFGRTAGVGPRGDGFDHVPHVRQTTSENIGLDAAAVAAHLRDRDGPVLTLFSVGFCFGGAQSWRLSAGDLGLAGAIGFYGIPSRVRDVIGQMRSPLLLLMAGADRATSAEEVADFDRQLTDVGLPHEVHVYAGAPHSFFDRAADQWQDACADAWRRVLAFIARYGKP